MNGMLVTIKAKETISMIINVAVPLIKVENCRDGNIHAFEIMNTECVLENIILRNLKISKATRMATKCFSKHGIPFQYDPDTKMSKRINLMKIKYNDQRFS
jgi:hypothetical protein